MQKVMLHWIIRSITGSLYGLRMIFIRMMELLENTLIRETLQVRIALGLGRATVVPLP